MAFYDRAASISLRPLSFRVAGVASGYAVAQVAPASGSRVPATAVALELLVSSTSSLNTDVRVEVSTDPAFGTLTYGNTLTDRADGSHTVTVSGLANLTKYHWRVRAAETGTTGWSAWSPVWTVTPDLNSGKAWGYAANNTGPAGASPAAGNSYVDENAGPGDTRKTSAYQYTDRNVGFPLAFKSEGWGYAYYGDVNTSDPGPHIWFVRPAAGRSGDGIRIYCFGVGDLVTTFSGSVQLFYGGTVGWVTVPVISWQTVPPGPDAYTAARKLDPETGYIDMQHSIVEIVIPDGAVPPGYPLRIRTVTA